MIGEEGGDNLLLVDAHFGEPQAVGQPPGGVYREAEHASSLHRAVQREGCASRGLPNAAAPDADHHLMSFHYLGQTHGRRF